jgi:hypothetical protein
LELNEFPYAVINPTQLNDELVPLALPGFIGSGRIARRRNTGNEWKVSDPYVIIKCDALTSRQRDDVQTVLDAHVADADYASP